LVARPHLIEALHEAVTNTRLTLISAPAGFGKTTLVQAWHATAVGGALPLAWISLDRADNDPVHFWTLVVAALRGMVHGVDGPTRGTLHKPRTPNADPLLPGLIRELNDLDQDIVLALDEYEVIDSSSIHRELGLLVEQLPVHVHVLMTTRADPPLPIARFRARGWLAEIRTDELRFGHDEVATFVGDVMGISNLSGKEITVLAERTEGWVAGVQLAALSLSRDPDRSDRLAELAAPPRFVVDYLVDDVLNRQPDDVRAFLLQTAILDQLCGPLCDAVTAGSGGQLMLEQLERANLFVVALDEERYRYRYHGLFADVLRLRLRQTRPDLLPALHTRAATWFAAAHMPREAVEHALAAGDDSFAAEQIEVLHHQLFSEGEHTTLQRWLTQLSETVLDQHPRLRVTLAWTNFQLGHWRTLGETVVAAQRSAVAHEDGVSRGILACLQAWWSVLRADGPEAIAAAQSALTLLGPDEPVWWQGSMATLVLGLLLEGNLKEAQELLVGGGKSRAEGISGQHRNVLDPFVLAEVSRHRGDLHQAFTLYSEIRRLAGDLSFDPLRDGSVTTMRGGWVTVAAHIDALVLQAEVLREWNQLSAAAELLRQALALEPYGQAAITTKGVGNVVRGRLLAAQGRIPEAFEALAHAAMDAESIDSRVIGDMATAYAMRVRLRQGDLPTVVAWSQDVARAGDDLLRYARQPEALTLVRLWLSRGEATRAGKLLEQLEAAAEVSGRIGSLAEILSLQSRLTWASGARGQAVSLLTRALALAEPGGYVRLFADDGLALVPILTELAAAQGRGRFTPPSREYVRTVLSAAGGVGAGLPGASERLGGTSQPLTARELEVLRLMATGAPNEQIAEDLVIGTTTVKSHINGIFRKLGVSNRFEAVSRARVAGLLETPRHFDLA
jgi:LuxR family maltose regulon positive regulatory protein